MYYNGSKLLMLWRIKKYIKKEGVVVNRKEKTNERSAVDALCRCNGLNPDELVLKMGQKITRDTEQAEKLSKSALELKKTDPAGADELAKRALEISDGVVNDNFFYELLVVK